jgi:hypothetical protein
MYEGKPARGRSVAVERRVAPRRAEGARAAGRQSKAAPNDEQRQATTGVEGRLRHKGGDGGRVVAVVA